MVIISHFSEGSGFYEERREGKQNKDQGGGVVDTQAVSLQVPCGSLWSVSLSWPSSLCQLSQIPRSGCFLGLHRN